MNIPFSQPNITKEEINAVTEVLLSGWLTIGDKVIDFESKLADYCNAPMAVAVDSCTSALTLALRSYDQLNPGEVTKIAVPALTFIATANAAYHATPAGIEFVDVGWDGNIDPTKISDSVELVIPVHYAGQVCDLASIGRLYAVIEDAAHAIGATYGGVHVGLSDYSEGACFSFYPTKNMTTIEGGAIISRSEHLLECAKTLSLHGLDFSHINRYQRSSLSKPILVNEPGYKMNMTNVEAAIGLCQLRKLNDFIARRKQLAKNYLDELKGKVKFLDRNGRDHVWHMCVILVDERDSFVKEMKRLEITCGIHYSPIIPAHPFYAELDNYTVGKYPVAEYISEHCVSLPLFYDLSENAQQYVIDCVKRLV